ncbi:uncharacterized protein LOC120683815 [Panicum virgatum]|uniref:Uncharacterized protein n=1 Tax=Panicum virgatum TaxID=38727 RepID=A0A8T0PX67_PANVG|nr:uncharacterized protein LOC120683815 [Panicum virgatum]KAG2564951.1 hypothetical protein PVAP13_7NG024800 [Panicum virgatum]KAG2564952.1 hypothetical protein PVAP13_7NG024800 [Panicum virgatum]
MEDHGGHPLLHGGHQLQPPAGAATLAYAWDYTAGAPFDDHDSSGGGGGQQLDSYALSTASELRRALVRALAELDASRAAHQAELRRMETEAARLAALVASAAAERDQLRRHCHSLLLLLHHQAQAAAPTPSLHAGVLGGGAAAAAVTDEHAPDAAAGVDDTELEMALARRLPEKGRLVEAVVSAGPLLQTLLLAGPLPRWRHPPPAAPADIPPFNPGHQSPHKTDGSNSSSASAGSSSPESNCSGGPPPPAAHALPSFHMSPFCM